MFRVRLLPGSGGCKLDVWWVRFSNRSFILGIGDKMTVESLISVFAILLTISLAAERLIEIGKPLFDMIKVEAWKASIKLLSAIIVGTACAALFRFDMLVKLGVEAPYLVGYLSAGLIASTGSTTINRFLEWLKTLRNDTTTTVTEYKVGGEVDVTKEVVVSSNKVVVQ
jgi:hypothetical protein